MIHQPETYSGEIRGHNPNKVAFTTSSQTATCLLLSKHSNLLT